MSRLFCPYTFLSSSSFGVSGKPVLHDCGTCSVPLLILVHPSNHLYTHRLSFSHTHIRTCTHTKEYTHARPLLLSYLKFSILANIYLLLISSTLWASSADGISYSFLIFPENRIYHFMQSALSGDLLNL